MRRLKKTAQGQALLAWIGETNLVLGDPDQRSVDVVDGRVRVCIPKRHCSLLTFHYVSHDIAHVIAASDDELFIPNLGLEWGSRNETARDNEEKTIGYQWALLQSLGPVCTEELRAMLRALDSSSVAKELELRQDRVVFHRDSVDLRGEWERKLSMMNGPHQP